MRQFTHPLALLLAAAALLSLLNHAAAIAIAIAAVIALNAALAFVQEVQAEHAVEALAAYLPTHARVLRDGTPTQIVARDLVPGDVLIVEEGDSISADAQIFEGAIEVNMSTLNGESTPTIRSGSPDAGSSTQPGDDMIFSGTSSTGGSARAVVLRTGMATELGRIAALSERTVSDQSPLERQVKRAAWLIGIVALAAAIAFLPLGAAAGLTLGAAISFSVGLLVANVPEGLLPTITLALAVGVRDLAKRGAVVKRLSSVETLGSTTVICTDKTGTLTQNRMQVVRLMTGSTVRDVDEHPKELQPRERELLMTAATCTTATPRRQADTPDTGDPTELALLAAAGSHGAGIDPTFRDANRVAAYRFDAVLKRMSTIDTSASGEVSIHAKGAPELLVQICTTFTHDDGSAHALGPADREAFLSRVSESAAEGLRVLAVAHRPIGADDLAALTREVAERDLCLLGFVAMIDPPRVEVRNAIVRAHRAGIRVHVVTGDNGLTAMAIARQVGIGCTTSLTGAELDAMTEPQLDELLSCGEEIVFARATPEAKLRVVDALRSIGEVVAVTGDGVNDAPALRRADIGVAMGRSGTEVAREAATMVLTDDNFATIITAVEGGRRVYDNVRKFIQYIFTHAVPEVVPFLAFALSGGAIPLPLTVMQILAIDLGTDTLPALALSREPAEPGLMDRPPRQRGEGVIVRSMLWRTWGFMGAISATLVLAGFFLTLHLGGWHVGDATGSSSRFHLLYRQATTVAWLGIVACQIGTAFAVRAERESLRTIGVASNRPLLAALCFEVAFAMSIAYAPALHGIFGTAGLSAGQLATVLPFPFIVWGADELRKLLVRRRLSAEGQVVGSRLVPPQVPRTGLPSQVFPGHPAPLSMAPSRIADHAVAAAPRPEGPRAVACSAPPMLERRTILQGVDLRTFGPSGTVRRPEEVDP
jgi:calcium-translocating P-type ATPase